MNVFIPLHKACKNVGKNGFIPVLLNHGKETQETYLSLNIDDRADFKFEIGNGGGKALIQPSIHYAVRLNREDSPATDVGFYTNRGTEIARSLHFGSAVEYLSAWLNEDRKQANFCNDIHAILSLNILEKLPQWIRYDLFSILESESMKQIFASRYFVEERIEGYKIPSTLRKVIKESSNNKTSLYLSELLSEAMQKPPKYSGTALKFDKLVQSRIKTFESL